MVNRLLILFLMLTCSSLSFAQEPQQSFTAFVDRTDISVNDVFTLTVRVDAQLGNASPSFSALDRDFEQLGISRKNSYSNVNGQIESWNDYSVSLKPKTTGMLSIPSFRLGGLVTTPISINVKDAPPTANSGNNEIFITTSISKENIYVQEQLLYTVKLFYTVGFDQGAQLTSPQVSNSVVQQLGSDETYQEIIDGLRYNVTERKFVVFPQSSGDLIIPPIYFTATMGSRGGLSRILSSRSNVRKVELTSDSHTINVMGVPASFPGQTWLPSSGFTLEESWSGPLEGIAIGESITRNITISAPGLSSSLLPDFEYGDIADLKFYPDQPLREDFADSNGVTGNRSEGTAIVPSATGEFTLPALEIPWWNTLTDSLEIATIPARVISVIPDINSPVLATSQTGFDPVSNQLGGASVNAASSLNQSSRSYLYWIIATVLLAAGWLFSTVMWLRNRRMLEQLETPAFIPIPAAGNLNTRTSGLTDDVATLPDLNTAYRVLERACEQSNLAYIKRALLSWGQSYFQSGHLITLDNLNHYAQSAELATLLRDLEQALYSEHEAVDDFSAKLLFKEVRRIHKSSKKQADQQNNEYSLPPLYKN